MSEIVKALRELEGTISAQHESKGISNAAHFATILSVVLVFVVTCAGGIVWVSDMQSSSLSYQVDRIVGELKDFRADLKTKDAKDALQDQRLENHTIRIEHLERD